MVSKKDAKKAEAAPASPSKKKDEVSLLAVGRSMKAKAGKRVSKAPSRLSLGAIRAEPKEFVIKKGKGKALGDIAHVATELNKRKATDKEVETLHRIAFGVSRRHLKIKSDLREFSGVVYGDDLTREKLETRVETKHINVLRDVCSLLGIERGGSAEDVRKRLVDYMEKPYAGEAPESPKKRARSPSPSRKAEKKTTKKGSKSEPAAKRRKVSDKEEKKEKKGGKKEKKEKDEKAIKRPTSAYMYFANEKRGEVSKAHKDEKVTEIAKRLGEMWRKLKDKSPYEKMAAKDKARYEKEKTK